MFRAIKRAARVGAVLVTATVLALMPSTAFADWEGVQYGYESDRIFWPSCDYQATTEGPTGRGCFYRDGDRWRVIDIASDGMRVGVHWRTNSDRSGMCVNKHGSGAQVVCDKDYGEGMGIIFRVGRCDGSVDPCGRPGTDIGTGWRNWTAWHEARA